MLNMLHAIYANDNNMSFVVVAVLVAVAVVVGGVGVAVGDDRCRGVCRRAISLWPLRA